VCCAKAAGKALRDSSANKVNDADIEQILPKLSPYKTKSLVKFTQCEIQSKI